MNSKDNSYDLEERLLDCAANIILLRDDEQPRFGARHITRQLIRSGTSVNTAGKRL